MGPLRVCGLQRQSTFTTSIGSEKPLSIPPREPDVPGGSPAVPALTARSPAPPSAAIRAASWPGVPAQLRGRGLGDVLEDDRRGWAGEGRGAEDLLVDAIGPNHVALAVVAGEPVEGRRGEGDAVARPDALVAVDPRPDGHQREP